jgi:excisionase family DNA binding protein
MVYRSRQSPEVNPRFAREEAPRLDYSKTALGAASNFGSAVDPNLAGQPLKPLAVSVPTAATLVGVGTTTIWDLIRQRRIEVVRIGRRTLPTMASLERLVAETSAPSRQNPEDGS